MGERHGSLFEPTFNRSVKISESDDRITSDAGVLIIREADHRLGITESLANQLCDPRNQGLIRYQMVELLRERVYGLALGYATQDDADRLAHDPAMKLAAWDRPGEQVLDERLASQPTQSRLIDYLAHDPQNRAALRDSLAMSCERHLRASSGDHAAQRITVDVDSFPIAVHGNQPGAAYNGYYRDTVYHPLVASYSVAGTYDSVHEGHRLGNGFVHAILRQGQVHTADGIHRFMQEVLRLTQGLGRVVDFRIDAGYVDGKVLDFLTDQTLRFIGRIKSNAVLERLAEPHLKRPPGRPPKEGYQTLVELGRYQAETWKHPQRLVLVIVDRPDSQTGQLQLFPDHFFLIVGWKPEQLSALQALEHYRARGTFEDRLGEFQQAIGPRLSHDDFDENETLLRLSLLAFNLASMLRNEYEASGSCMDLARFQRDVLKAGARLAKHSRQLIVYVARVIRPLWDRFIGRIEAWRLPDRFPMPRGARFRKWRPLPAHAFLAEVRRQ
jgi:hypothetical protein